MKYLLIIFFAIACSPYHKPKTGYSVPPELQDCKIFVISDGIQDLYVVKCPNSNTTTEYVQMVTK